MVLNRTFAILVCALALLTGATPGIAGDGWRVVQTVGSVKVGGGGLMPVALTRHQDLPAGAWVETAQSGRALLQRGTEVIAVAPNSRVQLPSEKINGNTQVLQSLGSVLYQIGKEKTPHFQVDTPYLAAVVKGTTFTVTVKKGAASVEVTEGLVEVATPDLAASEFVGPGFTATVRENQNTIAVDRTEAALKPLKQDGTKSSKQTIVIPKAIGEVTIDVSKASEGLAGAPPLPPTAKQTMASNTTTSNGSDLGNGDGDEKNGNGNGGGNNGNGLGNGGGDGSNGGGGGGGDGNSGNGLGNGGGDGSNGNVFGDDKDKDKVKNKD